MDPIARRARPCSGEEVAGRERRDLGGLTVSLATPEDTILSKLEWARKAGGSDRQFADDLGVGPVWGDGLIGKVSPRLGREDGRARKSLGRAWRARFRRRHDS